jgi:hypothetical protein
MSRKEKEQEETKGFFFLITPCEGRKGPSF